MMPQCVCLNMMSLVYYMRFFNIGKNNDESHLILEAAGEVIGEILARNNVFNSKISNLTKITREIVIEIIKKKNPELLNKL